MNKSPLDDTDLTLLQLLKDEPRLPVAELARRALVVNPSMRRPGLHVLMAAIGGP